MRRLAWPHGAVEGLHETTVDVAVVRSVDCRRILLMRVLRICRHIYHADWQLARLIHEAAELRRLVHITGSRLRHAIAILSGCHEIRVEGDVRADTACCALHLRTGATWIESLSVKTLAGIRLRERRHIGVR